VSRTYDSLGRPSLVTQYDASSSGNVTDEVAYAYDGWGGVTSFKQDVDSAVGGSGYHEMAYAYAKNTTGRNTVRRSSMTLPGSKTITLDYTADFDGYISRVSRLKDGATTLVRYEYLGQARVVGTIYAQPGISSKQFGSGDSFTGYLDRFNRILESRWATDLSPAINFSDADITYDRNSNITWVEDQVHTGFDVKYTMDDLDRLIDAEEGTRSGASITSRTRHQTWLHSGTSQLGHTGNWTRSKLDLDGDDNWNETNEYDDTRTHNAVNELTARDTDSNSSNNYTLTYDAAGNLTDDAESYEYEYDAFNRLREVRNQSATLLAEYRYNGLGFMIGVHEDTDADGDADGSDKWFYPAYDEGWREVARFRETDTSPKEQFVNATAGLDGYGRSSYINDVVCRDRDANTAWTSASDGVLEERYFYCPNWRGDVSALVSSGRQLHESGKYSPYGVPNSRPGADTDSDGDCDATDATQIQSWIDAPAYDVRGDVDLDGNVDSADKALAQTAPLVGSSLGWRNLSSPNMGNSRAFAGYSSNAAASTAVRHRSYEAALGRWHQRDPIASQLSRQRLSRLSRHNAPPYHDGLNLLQYCRSTPVSATDPSGLITGFP
jgi:RHS repeat-associated protein